MTTPWPRFGGRPFKNRPNALGGAFVLLFVSGAALGLLAAPVAASSEILREAYAPSTWDNSFVNVWTNEFAGQSFVARTSFLLTRLELYAFNQPESSPPDFLQVEVTSDAGNVPGATLGSAAQQGPQNWTWVAFSFYPWVSLTAGQRYWIVTQDSQPRPKGYEWAMNAAGTYANGEAQWYDVTSSTWTNNTGADLFFRAYGISGPALTLDVEPSLTPADPGTVLPLEIYFNNTGNDVSQTASITASLSEGLQYAGDDAASENGILTGPLYWTFHDVGVGTHRFTLWVDVVPNRSYYDGQSLSAFVTLNYTDASGVGQATVTDLATVSVLVPVIRVQALPTPAHVSRGETFNFTVSFFNLGSGQADFLWLNATPGPRLAILADDAAAAGATVLGPNAWRFRNVSSQVYLFNVTVQADPAAWPGDRLVLRLNATYTDGAGHLFDSKLVTGVAAIHGPSLAVELAVNPRAARPGRELGVTLFYNNTGDEVAPRVWLNATLPSLLAILDSQPLADMRTGNVLAYALQDVAVGGHAVTLRLGIPENAAPGTALAVLGSLNVTNASGVRLRPSAAQSSAVVTAPCFTLSLGTSATTVSPGESLDLVLRWNNTGNEAAARVWLNLTLPAKTLVVNATLPWTSTNGTAYGWEFSDVGPGDRSLGVKLEVSARALGGESLPGQLALRYERSDGVLSNTTVAVLTLTTNLGPPGGFGFEIVFLWIAVLIAVFLLFLLLGYMDILPRRRTLVDDIFLLHNSGILISHYSTTLRPDVDADIASGMLMAVRNFVADALRSKNGTLKELQYGDYRIHMVHGRHSILVTFTRGGDGKNLKMRMAEVLRNIETAYEKVLEAWDGRTEAFKGVEEYLLKLVQA